MNIDKTISAIKKAVIIIGVFAFAIVYTAEIINTDPADLTRQILKVIFLH